MSNIAFTPCVSDENCTGLRVCYKDVDWSPMSGGFCDCETPYYGWVGPNCEEFGPTTYVGIVGYAIILALSIPPILASVLAAIDILRHRELWQWNALTQTLVLITLCFISFFFYGLLNLLERLSPDLYVEFFNNERSHPLAPFSSLISILAVTFFVFGASNIVLVWINIANSVSILSNESTLPRVRLVLRAIQMYGVCLVVIILSTRNLTVGGVGLMPVLGGILALYVIGRKRFTSILRNVTYPVGSQDAEMSRNVETKMLPLIERTFVTISFALFLVLVFTIVGAALDANRRNISPKGVVSPVMTCLLVIAYCGWMGNLGTAIYVYVLMYNRRLKVVGPVPYGGRIEAFLFAGYSTFQNSSTIESATSRNPSYLVASEETTVGNDSEGKVRGFRAPSFDGLAKLSLAAATNVKGMAKRIRKTSKVSQNSYALETTAKASSTNSSIEAIHGSKEEEELEV